MADKIPDLHASVRAGTGKGAARQARRDGDVPGIVYGGGVDPQPISINYNMLLKKLKAGRFMATLHNLKVEGQEDVRVICRGVQRHVVKDLPTHIDLMRLKRTSRVSIFIAVDFINEKDCPGLKQGGNLTVVRNEVELNVLAGEIPENIVIDLAGLEIGDTINISDVSLPAGAKPTIDRDFVIANLDAPRAMLAEDDEDEDAPAADEVPTGDAEEAKEE